MQEKNKHQNKNKKVLSNQLRTIKTQSNHHIPVLLEPVLTVLAPEQGNSYLDLTAGYGGHSSKVLERTGAYDQAVLVDRDQMAISALEQVFAGKPVQLVHTDFLSASRRLAEQGRKFDMILADLGVSSPHLDTASRGFAFAKDGPLDMRMDQSSGQSAADIVNTYDEAALTDVLKRYGEEPRARRIAQLIIANRPFTSTAELAQTVARAYPGHSRTHPATRTFQALRIAVNDELELLRRSLPLWLALLAPGGRLAVISFHSLEDRIVKDTFREVAGERYDTEFRLITKKPITGDKEELVFNPRARSSKLRAVLKINK